MLFCGTASRNLFISKQVCFGVFASLNIHKSDNIIDADDELQKELKLTKKTQILSLKYFREDSN